MRTGGDLDSDKRLLNATLGMVGEAGEFADLVKKVWFQGLPLEGETESKLIEELGDLLWYVAQACTALEVSLSHVMRRNIAKLEERYPNGFVPRFASGGVGG